MSADIRKTLPLGPRPIQGAEVKEMHTQMLLRIKAARESRDMRELAKIGDEIETTWSSLDAGYYASLMLEVCNALSSTDLKDDDQYILEQKYASLVLSKQLEIPITIEANLVFHIQDDLQYVKRQLDTDEWAERRRDKAEIWLRTWQRLTSAIDPNFDFKDLPLTNIPLPRGVSGAAGMSPDYIKEPALRAQYQSAIYENSKKAETYRIQFALYKTRETYGKAMGAYLIRVYSRPPDNPQEIEASLKAHLLDDNIRTRILDKLRK
jgi:hypothetical protein